MKTKDMKALIAQAVALENHTETKTAGESRTIPAGKTVGRLVEYIELGVQPQRNFNGKPKEPAEQVRITFEFLASKNIYEVGDEKRKVADRLSITMVKSTHEKAKFKKIFNKLRYSREDVTHYAQMLGDPFQFTVTHNESEKNGKKKIYANLTNESGEFMIEPPFNTDSLTEVVTDLRPHIPNAISEEKLFVWDYPTKESWDGLFIDGERTVKDDKGKETTVSKNWIQNLILSAKNMSGSALEQMLEAEGVDMTPSEAVAEEEEEVEEPVEEVAKAPAKKSGTASCVVKATPKAITATTTPKQSTVAKTVLTTTKSPSKPVAAKAKPVNPLEALGLA